MGAGPAGARLCTKPRGGFQQAIMARKMQIPRTGKRSKKAKEKRKNEPDDEKQRESTDEIKKSSAERDEPGESGEISTDPPKVEQEETGKAEDGNNEELLDANEVKSQQQSDHETEGKEGEEGEGEMEREGEGEEGEGESDDDDAPEDITLAEGKTMAMEQQKDEGEQIKR